MEHNTIPIPDQKIEGLVGSYRTFGADGVSYQVVGLTKEDPAVARIVLLETGEEANYPLKQLVNDPLAR